MFRLNFHWGVSDFQPRNTEGTLSGYDPLKQSLEILFFHPNLHMHVCGTNLWRMEFPLSLTPKADKMALSLPYWFYALALGLNPRASISGSISFRFSLLKILQCFQAVLLLQETWPSQMLIKEVMDGYHPTQFLAQDNVLCPFLMTVSGKIAKTLKKWGRLTNIVLGQIWAAFCSAEN